MVIWAVAIASDRGAAVIAAIALVLSAVVPVSLMPGGWRQLIARPRSLEEIRQAILVGVEREQALVSMQILPRETQVELHIDEAVRAPTRGGIHGSSADMLSIFRAAKGRLLLLGEPGSGKTASALALCSALFEQAKEDRTAPIPLFISLGKSHVIDQSFSEMIAEQLHRAGINSSDRRIASSLVLPVLDGLDEVPDASRTACARTIAAHVISNPGSQIVVCSRRREFERLHVNMVGSLSILVLQPITANDVVDYLARIDERRFHFLVQQTPSFATHVMKVLAERLRHMNLMTRNQAVA